MDLDEWIWLVTVTVGLAALGVGFCIWIMKKAGIQPMNYYKKLFYENVTGIRDSGTGNHQSYFSSKKGGKQIMEIVQTRGVLVMEFYTEDGEVLQRWQSGDPPVFTVAIPPRVKVYRRTKMTNFSGTIIFRK